MPPLPKIEIVNKRGRLSITVDGVRMPMARISIDNGTFGGGDVTVVIPLRCVTLRNDADAPKVLHEP